MTHANGEKVRLVSLCGTHARVISADFSYSYLLCIATRDGDLKGHLPSSALCNIEIAAYRDLRRKEDFLDLMKELAAKPRNREKG